MSPALMSTLSRQMAVEASTKMETIELFWRMQPSLSSFPRDSTLLDPDAGERYLVWRLLFSDDILISDPRREP
jgi:hypothetical protein